MLPDFDRLFRLDYDPVIKDMVELFCRGCGRTIAWSQDSDLLHRLALVHLRIHHSLYPELEAEACMGSGVQPWFHRAVLKVGELVAQLSHSRLR